MKRMCIGLLCLGSMATMAADRIWDGGGIDVNWSTSDNWDGTAAVAGDSLFFGGTAGLNNSNDLAFGTSFAGITFNSGAGAFFLHGNAITLAGSLVNNDNSYQTLNLPLNLSGITTVDSSVAGGRVVVNGRIGGSGGITKEGSDYLSLTSSNSYDGATLINNGYILMNNAWALGSTNGNTTIDRSNVAGALIIDGTGMDIYEDLSFVNLNSTGNCIIHRGGSNTLHGAYIVQAGRHRIENSTLVFRGGMGRIGNPFFVLGGNGTVIYDGPVDLGSGTFYLDDWTTTYLNTAANVWGSCTLAKGTLIMNVANALPADSYMRLSLSYGPSGTLDLNGFDQTIKYIYTGTTNPGSKLIKSDAPAMLTLTDSGNNTLAADFKGRVGLSKGGAGNLILTGTASDTTGDFIVNAGTLTVTDGSSLGGSTNVVVNSAVIHIKGNAALSPAATISINGSGSLNIDADKFAVVDSLLVDGVAQVFGDWGTTASGASHVDDTHFQGSGILIVTGASSGNVVSSVWDAGAGDDNFSSAANWDGDVTPAFYGFDRLIFGSNGATAVVDSAISIYAIELNRTADFVIAEGAGDIELGSGGILAESTDSNSRTYIVGEDVKLSGLNQKWQVNKNGAASVILNVTGVVSSVEWFNELRVAGDASVKLQGNNSYYGATFVEDNSVLNIYHDNALGSTNQPTTVLDGGILQLYGGINVPENITIYGDSSTGYGGSIRSNGGSNTWSGLIDCPGSRIRCNSGSLDLAGGVTGAQFVLGANSGSFIRLVEKPMNIVGNGFYPHTSGGAIVIAVTNNNAAQINVNGSETRFDVPQAFNTTIKWDLNTAGAAVNLNGNNQTIAHLVSRYSTPGSTKIYSNDPATLTVNQSVDSNYRNEFAGQLSLVKSGAGKLTLHAQQSTSGGITVEAGALAMTNLASFVSTPEVSVSGGMLILQVNDCINNAAVMTLSTGGVIDIGAGLVEDVGWLTINGTDMRAGTYGASGSGAQYINDTFFSGSGQLRVLHDSSGTVIIVY